MPTLLSVLSLICGIGSLVCFILVLVKMFQNDQTVLGVVCIVLAFCCGIGALIAFVYGWMKAGAWDIQNVMMAWTALIVVNILLNIVALAMGATLIPEQLMPAE